MRKDQVDAMYGSNCEHANIYTKLYYCSSTTKYKNLQAKHQYHITAQSLSLVVFEIKKTRVWLFESKLDYRFFQIGGFPTKATCTKYTKVSGELVDFFMMYYPALPYFTGSLRTVYTSFTVRQYISEHLPIRIQYVFRTCCL